MLLELEPLSTHERVFLLLLFAILCAGALWFVFSRLQHFRLIADTPTARIRSAPQGFVELTGHVISGEDGMLQAPLSGRSCVWYHYTVEELDDSNDRRRWRHIRSGTSNHWFQINDGTGVCLIDPTGAEVSTRHRHSWLASAPYPGHMGLDARATAAVLSTVMGGERYRYTERLIFEHEPIYALGHFSTVGGGRDQLNLAATARDLLRIWKQDTKQLHERFDTDGDGRISMAEWQLARETAEQEALLQQQQLHQLPSMNVLSDPEDSQHPYLLSTLNEAELMRRYRWISLACFSGCLISFWLFLEVLLAKSV